MRRKQAPKLLPWIPIMIGWAVMAATVMLIDPGVFGPWSPVGLLILGWLVIWATGSVVTGRRIRGAIIATLLVIYLTLRYLGLGNWFFAATLLGLAVAGDRWLSR